MTHRPFDSGLPLSWEARDRYFKLSPSGKVSQGANVFEIKKKFPNLEMLKAVLVGAVLDRSAKPDE
jgi:hypothetical protein